MKTLFLPVFTQNSAMHRVFGDPCEYTEIHRCESVLSGDLIKKGSVSIRVRRWFYKTKYQPVNTCDVRVRFEVYYNGILVDYSMERAKMVKTLQWLVKMGQVNTKKAA